MNRHDDHIERDWLDEALHESGREHRADYLADDGFTARVAAMLPPPATLPAWRRPALIALWTSAVVAIAWALPGVAGDFAFDVARLIGTKSVSLANIATGLAALGLAGWIGAVYALRRIE